MAFFKKKPVDEIELPPLPEEGEELPPLPPLPGEEELPPFPEPEEAPEKPRKMKPAAPEVSGVSMPLQSPLWQQATAVSERQAATVFVKLDKYREIMRTVSDIDSKLEELRATLDKISSVKIREGEIIDGWAAMLNDAKSKIEDIHGKLTKPEG